MKKYYVPKLYYRAVLYAIDLIQTYNYTLQDAVSATYLKFGRYGKSNRHRIPNFYQDDLNKHTTKYLKSITN